MNESEGALRETRWPFASNSLLVPLILIIVACGAIAYYGYQLAKTMEQSVAASARVDGQLTAREITAFLDREQERLRAFVIEKQPEIREILAFPDNWPAIDAVQTSLRRMFRGALAFTVTGADGKPMFEDFDGLVGAVCQASMRDYAQAMSQGLVETGIPPVHPVPGAYHFDLISPWQLEGGEAGLFFVSMSPGRIAELLDAAAQASGTRMLLVNRDDPTLIEVSAYGARDSLGEDIRLQPEALTPGHFIADLPGTQWRLVVLPDSAALAEAVNDVYVRVAILVLALLLISIVLLFLHSTLRAAQQLGVHAKPAVECEPAARHPAVDGRRHGHDRFKGQDLPCQPCDHAPVRLRAQGTDRVECPHTDAGTGSLRHMTAICATTLRPVRARSWAMGERYWRAARTEAFFRSC